MTVKQLIQAEIEKIPEHDLDELYEIIKKFTEQKNSTKKEVLSRLNFNGEIVGFLSNSLTMEEQQLATELALWEAASDEDWLKTETMLAEED